MADAPKPPAKLPQVTIAAARITLVAAMAQARVSRYGLPMRPTEREELVAEADAILAILQPAAPPIP